MVHMLLRNKLPNLSGHPQKLPGLACTPWHMTFLHLSYTQQLLADNHRCSCIPSKPTPRHILSTLLEFEDKQHNYWHSWLCAPHGAAPTHSNCCTNDILPIYLEDVADTMHMPLWRSSDTDAGSIGVHLEGGRCLASHHLSCAGFTIWQDIGPKQLTGTAWYSGPREWVPKPGQSD